jgi:hypothetical protein
MEMAEGGSRMDEKVVPLFGAKKDDMEILLSINKEVANIGDPGARQEIREALRRVAARIFSSPLSG